MESKEWTAKADEELRIPAEYLTGLKYEVVILSSRKDFTPLKCKRYERDGQVVTLYDVIWDTSKKNARREIIQQVVSWHEKIELLNIGCIIIPVPEAEENQGIEREIPHFSSEDEERKFWARHDSTPFLRGAEEVILKKEVK